ncbi:hypothetical protein FGO68_gene17340 [Halteria grandinella]|uniref:TLDc domain-containing protein n=1 Tax=Halteria grandinella TaxID=5974 RepID=A0A8J8NRL5_HALGN|nr:hypothetical protein FGO68_gene17340 [Halteria grandinella]
MGREQQTYKSTNVILFYNIKNKLQQNIIMVERQPQALSVLDIMRSQVEYMDMCDCRSGEKVIYKCDEEECPNFIKQKLYCSRCMVKTKHNHIPTHIAIESQNTSDDWNTLRQNAKSLVDNLVAFVELHRRFLEALDRYLANEDQRFMKKLDMSKELLTGIENFYKENVNDRAVRGDILGLQTLRNDFSEFKRRLEQLEFLIKIGPAALWRLYNGIIQQVGTHQILENYPSHSCEVFLFLKSYLLCIKINELEDRLTQSAVAQIQALQQKFEEVKAELLVAREEQQLERNQNLNRIEQLTLKMKSINSVILDDETKQRKMFTFFEQAGTPLMQSHLLYRGTISTFAAAEFHKLCDNRSKTLTIVRTTEGIIVGGYTSQFWNSTSSYKVDPTAWVFNLDQPNIFKVKPGGNNAIYANNDRGPTFGCGHILYIANTANINTCGYVNQSASYENLENINLFQRQGTTQFQVTEVEVFQV